MELGIYTTTYIGKNGASGFKKDQKYTINIKKRPNECYEIEELEDNLYTRYSSEISIRQNWDFDDLK